MKMVWSLIIVLLVTTWGVNPQSQPQSSFSDQPKFPNHYLLAVQYSLSICSVEPCRQTTRENLPTVFSIHGLWPKNKDGSDAPGTTTEEFNTNKLDPKLKDELRKYWFDIYKYDKPQLYNVFWKHEWDYHGVRSGLGLNDYFVTTVKTYEKFLGEFQHWVQKNKYVPGTFLNFKQFENSFAVNLAVPWIRCAGLKNGTVVVKEMLFRVEPIGSGEFKPHPYSQIDKECIPPQDQGGLAMLPSAQEIIE